MDRAELSSAIIQEMQALVGEALEAVVPELLTMDRATLEQRVQQVGRVLLGQLIARVAAGHAQLLPRPVCCTDWGGQLKRQERPRPLVGLVGDYALHRDYYWCAAWQQGEAPLDEALGLGPGTISPGLLRVVARATVETTFTPAVEQGQESLGAPLSDETARRLAEQRGAVAEAQTQAAIARAQQGQPVWAEAEIQSAHDTTTLAVEVDGVLVQQQAGWQEMKVVTVAPLGPDLHTDPDSGRRSLAWGSASYGVGVEEAEDFWGRVYVEALRRGLGTPAVRTVVVLGDGARWIWPRARAFLGLPGVEVVEIVDLYHAYSYLWAVGHALFGAETAAAADWVEPRKDPLYTQGTAPVLAALASLTPTTEQAGRAIGDAQPYFTQNAARMDYAQFVARQLAIGSGAVERACKGLVEARLKQAGMRWGVPGSQAIASLRALHRSGRWAAFWQTQPYRQLPRCARRPVPRAAAAAEASPPPATATASPPVPVEPPGVTAPAAPRPAARPKPTPAQRPLLLPRSA
jgi:Uncharacterised protein family (UPF0236)